MTIIRDYPSISGKLELYVFIYVMPLKVMLIFNTKLKRGTFGFILHKSIVTYIDKAIKSYG